MGKIEKFPNLLPATLKTIGVLDVFATTIPILQSTNEKRTVDFYVNELSFEVLHYDDYFILTRDKMELHYELLSHSSGFTPQNCYIRGSQVSFLYEEFKERNVQGVTKLITGRWNMREFYLSDPDGNKLRFAYKDN